MPAAAAAAPSPLKPLERDADAIQSLLGLAAAPSGELSPTGPWQGWESSGAGREDAQLRRRLSHSDMQQPRLRFPGAFVWQAAAPELHRSFRVAKPSVGPAAMMLGC